MEILIFNFLIYIPNFSVNFVDLGFYFPGICLLLCGNLGGFRALLPPPPT